MDKGTKPFIVDTEYKSKSKREDVKDRPSSGIFEYFFW